MPEEWRDALIVGDLIQCDNWRGISLLDVTGKILANIIHSRLQNVVKEVLSDSQCGFQAGRGCAVRNFCARQLVEKTKENNTKLYFLFVYL